MTMAEADLGLFQNERESNLESTVAMIEDVLLELGHFINNCRVEVQGSAHSWRIKKGSAETLITLVDREDFVHLRATAAVMTMSASVHREGLFARLLELNDSVLCGIAFSLHGDQVRLVAERSTLDLDRSEVLSLIDQLHTAADDYDDDLVREFGGAIGGELLLD